MRRLFALILATLVAGAGLTASSVEAQDGVLSISLGTIGTYEAFDNAGNTWQEVFRFSGYSTVQSTLNNYWIVDISNDNPFAPKKGIFLTRSTGNQVINYSGFGHEVIVRQNAPVGTTWVSGPNSNGDIVEARIEAVETVTVPAGTFTGCLRFHKRFINTPELGPTWTEWVTPDLFLVAKYEINVGSYVQTIELAEFHQGTGGIGSELHNSPAASQRSPQNLFDMTVGNTWIMDAIDAAGNPWEEFIRITGTAVIPSTGKTYSLLEVSNVAQEPEISLHLVRSTPTELFTYNGFDHERLDFMDAPVGTTWVSEEPYGDIYECRIEAIETVTVPAGIFSDSIKTVKRCLNCQSPNTEWIEWIQPGFFMVKWIDYWIDQTENPPLIYELREFHPGEGVSCNPCLDWRNHGQFVWCVANQAESLVSSGEMKEEEKETLVSTAARSDIGKKGFVPSECQ